ncbi:hypothetical protein CHUAL_005386 [Chamberlinius hualienensis]
MKTVVLITFMLLCVAIVISSNVDADGVAEGGAPSAVDQLTNNRQDRSANNGKNGKGNKNRSGGGGNGGGCRYTKGSWGECDTNTNQRSRTLTLKRGDQSECEQTKIETRKCKKPCRYTRGQWTVCDGSVHMKERIDQLKAGSDPSCETTKRTVKKCKGKNEKKRQQHGRR